MTAVGSWLRLQAFLAPPAILLATGLLWWAGGYTDSLSMAGLAPLGVLAYATFGAVIEGGAYMVLWALEQRRKWQAEREQREQQLREEREQREQKLREEGRVRGREELAALLLREAREGESVRQALERIDNRHTEPKE